MNEEIKKAAQDYIKNNCKYYEKYFCSRDLHSSVRRVTTILECKFLSINAFCYYVNYSFGRMSGDYQLYCNLSKEQRKLLYLCNKAMAKIYMHLDLIFAEISNIKSICKSL